VTAVATLFDFNGVLIDDELVHFAAFRDVVGSQQGLICDQRQRNITSTVFRLHPWNRSKAEGKRVLLIDDVFTTGATVTACVRSLHREGAEAVDVLTLARVVRDAGETISALGPDRVDCEARI
jgi:adenine/guanine phosphoribosyltransferase-like PRPP-binding protein